MPSIKSLFKYLLTGINRTKKSKDLKPVKLLMAEQQKHYGTPKTLEL